MERGLWPQAVRRECGGDDASSHTVGVFIAFKWMQTKKTLINLNFLNFAEVDRQQHNITLVTWLVIGFGLLIAIKQYNII